MAPRYGRSSDASVSGATYGVAHPRRSGEARGGDWPAPLASWRMRRRSLGETLLASVLEPRKDTHATDDHPRARRLRRIRECGARGARRGCARAAVPARPLPRSPSLGVAPVDASTTARSDRPRPVHQRRHLASVLTPSPYGLARPRGRARARGLTNSLPLGPVRTALLSALPRQYLRQGRNHMVQPLSHWPERGLPLIFTGSPGTAIL